MLTIVERMDEEFIKMLQACDAHSTEYITRSDAFKNHALLLNHKILCK
jgi:Eukaryotic translation initiation factor 3 subunit 8 N-terminus